MALMIIKFYSEILQLQTRVNVLCPDRISPEQPLVTLYLLHGLSDDASSWLLNTSLKRYTEDQPFIIIMPEVHRSYYTDMADGNRYWTYLTDELPAKIKNWFPVTDKRDYRFVAGLSMGGYGALKWGLNDPEKFSGIISISGAVDVKAMRLRLTDRRKEFNQIFGDLSNWDNSVNDLFGLVDKVSNTSNFKPDILQFCGTSDSFYKDNLQFQAKLDMSDIPHSFYKKENAGHEWSFWDEAVQLTLEWIEKKLARGNKSGVGKKGR